MTGMDSCESLSRNMLAEFLGTMGLIIVCIGSIILPQLVWGSTEAYIFVFVNAVAVGFVLFALIECFGPASGAHFNPAVSLAQVVSKEMGLKKAAYYIFAQISGAMAGILLLNMMFYDTLGALLFVSDNNKATLSTCLSEFVCTFMLLTIIFGCVRGRSDKTSLAVGLFVGGMIVATSSTMYANPAVDLARVFTNSACGIAPLSSLLFMASGILGAISASIVSGWLYPVKLEEGEKCEPFDCSCKTEEAEQ